MSTDESGSVSQVISPPASEAPAIEPERAESPSRETSRAKPESQEIQELRRAKEEHTDLEGRVIGWNRGGFHVVIGRKTAFCPRSEMELGQPKSPKTYLDRTMSFQVLKVQKRGQRIVVSRAASLRAERARLRAEARERLEVGATVSGRISSLTDFGAFVDLGGLLGLVHVSEISHQRVEHPQNVLQIGQEVSVKVLRVEKGGKRISLSMRALEPSPWRNIRDRFPEGTILRGRVERVTRHGVFVELEPGLSGLLPASAMSLPRDASAARAYPPGREISVQVMSVDERRQRVSLAPEGSTLEGTRRDYQTYLRSQHDEDRSGFHALAKALKKARQSGD